MKKEKVKETTFLAELYYLLTYFSNKRYVG